MTAHRARVHWQLSGTEFLRGRYSRAHEWTFDGGVVVPASPSPVNVPAPWSDPAGVDPEEAFVASIASCHMLTFLYLASKAGVEVVEYEDDAAGFMTAGDDGRLWVSRVELRPRLRLGAGGAPPAATLAALHEQAHAECFIANSVRTEIVVDPA